MSKLLGLEDSEEEREECYLEARRQTKRRRVESQDDEDDNNKDEEDETDLMKDLVSIITSFCCRLYGLRRGQNKAKKIKAELEK